jgi:hypothetical protein
MKKLFFALFAIGSLVACKKDGEDVPPPAPVVLAERLELTPSTNSLLVGQTAQLTAKFFNNQGNQANLPATAVYSSDNAAVATVSSTGLVTAVAVGQTNAKITYNSITATVSVTVVANNNVLATVVITPGTAQEMLVGGTANLTAMGQTITGTNVPGLTFTWASNSTANATVSANGMVTAVAAGNSNVTATANGITSAPTMIQVIRQGSFSGQGSTGTAKLRIDAGVLKLITSNNFGVSSGAPDLRIYLSNSPSSITGALQVAPLSTAGATSGMRTWNLPANVTITQYRYAIVWCVAFGGAYGVADFGI